MSERNEKDPFAEYDKFWDELNEIDEIKDDEDYFKEKRKQKPYTFNSFYKQSKSNNGQANGQNIVKGFTVMFVFFVISFIIIGLFNMPVFRMGMSFFFPIQVIFSFIFFITIVSFILRKIKNK